MKKTVIFIIAVVLLITLYSCVSLDKSERENMTATQSSETTEVTTETSGENTTATQSSKSTEETTEIAKNTGGDESNQYNGGTIHLPPIKF